MRKATIQLERLHDHIQGYGLMRGFPDYSSRTPNPENESNILDKIVEWARQNPKTKIYKHIVRVTQDENVRPGRAKTGPIGQEPTEKDFMLCDRVVYLDIYYQDE